MKIPKTIPIIVKVCQISDRISENMQAIVLSRMDSKIFIQLQ
jgi:hypothetical protein